MHTTGGDDYSTFKFAAPKISDVLFRRASTPVEEFSFSKPASILDAESPQKRRRVYKKKRSKGSSTTRRNGARQSVEKQTLPLTQNYDSANEDGFDGDEDTGDDTLFRQMSITRENVDGFQVDDGYVEFEERLTWDDMMFTRITAKVFVVTGWSMKDKTTTVRKIKDIPPCKSSMFPAGQDVPLDSHSHWTYGNNTVSMPLVVSHARMLSCTFSQ